MSDWLLSMLPHICLGMGGFLVFCAGGFLKKRPAVLLFGMALGAIILAGSAVFFFPQGTENPNKILDIDAFGAYFYLLLAGITILTLLFARQYALHQGFSGDEFYGILLFAALSMFLTTGALHWLAFFLGVEFLSISFYILIALATRKPGSSEAALKYFIMGSVAGAFLAFGIAVLYAATGSMVIAESLGPYADPAQQNLILLSPADPEAVDREDLAEYRGIGLSHPLIGGVLAISLISLAGLPPTGGFFGKFILFRAALLGDFEALAVIGILSAIVSFYVYLKVIVALYFSPRTGAIPVPEPPLLGRAAGVAVMVLIVWMGVFPSPLLEVIEGISGGF